MRAVIQRVKKASVEFNNQKNEISEGLLVFLGIGKEDTKKELNCLLNKIIKLRIFEENEKMNKSIKDIDGEILLVSQFTLYANSTNGNRPSFEESMKYSAAKKMYELFIEELSKTNIKYKTGFFGENMDVSLINDGPVTIILDTKELMSEK